jgi:uncharacterized protein YndB with AHSA1/START domain
VKDDELRIERLIPVPPDKVYALWSEPDRLSHFGRNAADTLAV